MNPTLFILTFVAALASAAVAGIFFPFSTFLMSGLDRLPDDRSVAAMQSINVTAPRAPLMAVMFGTAAICLALVVWGIAGWGDRRAALLVAGGVLYIGSSIVVTVVGNVPLNDALEAVDPDGPAAAAEWERYRDEWTRWNHARVIGPLAAAAAFVGALAD